jgi:1-deoxy-D-xylulose-5-phosphate reductoisomerase
VIRRLPERLELVSLAAGRSVRRVAAQARRFRAGRVVVAEARACVEARKRLGPGFRVGWGPAALLDAATDPRVDTVVMAMSGTQGLLAVLAALERGKRVCIATKEILVGFGEQLMRAARNHRAEVLPIDSELAAVHQCLAGQRRILLTASGGPFWRTGPPARAALKDVLRHPTWNMGRKITVDSATLMNKGLEVIETVRLFGVRPEQVETVVHPQSVIHSLVEFVDGSVKAQLSSPDMRLPIQYALLWPDRLPSPARFLDLHAVARFDFHPTDAARFPCLGLAYQSLRIGGAAPCVLNAANQVAVEAFLAGRVEFGTIPDIIAAVLTEHAGHRQAAHPGIKRLLAAEARATRLADKLVARS